MNRSINMISVLIAAFTVFGTSLHGQPVIHSPQTSGSLDQQFTWAQNEASVREYKTGYWIGYSIQRLMEENSFTGTFHSDEKHNHPSLTEIIFGMHESNPPRYDAGASHRMIKKDIIASIGMHEESAQAFKFLKDIVESDGQASLREQAVFWLGQQHNEKALSVLMRVARIDNSEEVRENAIFAVSEINNPSAVDSLIALTRGGNDGEVRNKAMFWLAQKASDKAVKTITAIAEGDDDSEIQKQAIFALSQLSDDESIPALIKIARTHRNTEIRKTAIFWLGQSENQAALDAIVDIIKE